MKTKNKRQIVKKGMQEHLKQIREITDESIERGFDNAHIEWRSMALSSILKVAEVMKEFTMNDVRILINRSPLKTHDNRAMGGVIMTAHRLEWVKPTGAQIISKIGHKSPLQIWKSLVYKPKNKAK